MLIYPQKPSGAPALTNRKPFSHLIGELEALLPFSHLIGQSEALPPFSHLIDQVEGTGLVYFCANSGEYIAF